MNIPIPDPRWWPYNGPPARARDAAGTNFYACLGSLGKDKSTFYVWVWAEYADGRVEVIEVVEPPNDQASFSIEGGRLLLTGPRDKVLVEREVPGFVPPPTALTLLDVALFLIGRLGNAGAPLTQAVRRAVGIE